MKNAKENTAEKLQIFPFFSEKKLYNLMPLSKAV